MRARERGREDQAGEPGPRAEVGDQIRLPQRGRLQPGERIGDMDRQPLRRVVDRGRRGLGRERVQQRLQRGRRAGGQRMLLGEGAEGEHASEIADVRDPTGSAASVGRVMGIVYAIANQKGGVGKTTTAVNVAACIAEAGYETLLVDVDPQGNATVGVGADRHDGAGLYDVLCGDVAAADAVRATGIERLSLIASTPDLAGATMELPRQPGSERRLRELLGPLRGAYAYTLLDCPPSLGPLTVNALVAADRVIVPVQTEYFALEGLAGLLDTLALIQRELNPRLTVAGMLLTMHDARTKLAQDVEAEVRRHFPSLVYDTVIPRNVRLGEAPSFGRPVIHHDPHCAGADAYFELAKEVASRG